MCELAINDINKRIKIFDYEINHQLNGKTIDFVKLLKNDPKYKDYNFSMIIGQDNANTFHTWVNYDELERMMRFVVIPRAGVERDMNVDWYLKPPHIFLNPEKTGIMNTSSTTIREMLKNNDPGVSEYLDPKVLNYIQVNNLYI